MYSNNLQVVRFSQECKWEHQPSKMWCTVWRVVPDVSKEIAAVNLKVQEDHKEFFKISVTTHPKIQRSNPRKPKSSVIISLSFTNNETGYTNFEVFMAVKIRPVVLWVITQCSLVSEWWVSELECTKHTTGREYKCIPSLVEGAGHVLL